MEYIKHLIMLKWDLFMIDLYSTLLWIGVIAGIWIVFMVVVSILAAKEKISESRQNRKQKQLLFMAEQMALKDAEKEESLRKLMMKT